MPSNHSLKFTKMDLNLILFFALLLSARSDVSSALKYEKDFRKVRKSLCDRIFFHKKIVKFQKSNFANFKNVFIFKNFQISMEQKLDRQNEFIESFNIKGVECARKNGTQLNGDCLIQVFEELDFPTLLIMTKMSKSFAYYASMAFRHSFIDHEFGISYHGSNDSNASVYPYLIYGKRITIYAFDLILQTLRYFGRFIQKIQIEFSNVDASRSRLIAEFIQKHCIDSLIEVDIVNVNVFKYMQKPFSNVKHIYFWSSSAPNIPRMNEIFPVLRNLTLTLDSDEIESIDCFFPHLQHLTIKKLFDMDFIERFLRTNSHIQSATILPNYPKILFNKICSLLPNVNHLTVAFVPFVSPSDPEIRFENVTKMTALKEFNPSVNIRLPNLQELHMTHYFYAEQWTIFLKRHMHLKRFSMKFSNMSDDELNGILVNLPNLEEFAITSDGITDSKEKSIEIRTIIEFIRKCDSLQKFQFDNCAEDDQERIRKEFHADWIFVKKSNRISMQKLNNN